MHVRVFGVDRPIPSFGFFYALGIVIAGVMFTRALQQKRLDVGAGIAVVGFTTGGGIVGAYLTFVLVETLRTGNFYEAWSSGGFVFFGGAIGALGSLVVMARALRLSVPMCLDLGVPGALVGHAMGRIGCFLGGCCYGAPHRAHGWGVVYSDPRAPAFGLGLLHPVQLYESFALLVLASVFVLRARRGGFGTGRIFASYVVAYCAVRFFLEWLRADERGALGALSTGQWSALVIGGSAAVLIRGIGRKARAAA